VRFWADLEGIFPLDSCLLGESQCGCKQADREEGDEEISYQCNHVVLCTELAEMKPIFGAFAHLQSHINNAARAAPISLDCDYFSRC
jgi:hypothetical protein